MTPARNPGNPGPSGGAVHGGGATGLEYTFLIFLLPLLAAGLLALLALRSYPRDVATAIASRPAVSRGGGGARRHRPHQQPAA